MLCNRRCAVVSARLCSSKTAATATAAAVKANTFSRNMASSSSSSCSTGTNRVTDYEGFFTARSLARQPSAIRALVPLMSLPGMISLGGGNPNPSTFPFKDLTFSLKEEAGGGEIHVDAVNLQKALQYSPTNGMPELVKWLKELQVAVHQPPYADFDVCLGNGSQDVLTRAFDMLLAEGDSLLIESPAYVGSLAFLRPLGCKFVEVPTDAEGLNPDELDRVLSNWADPKTKPKVLYSVPVGGNPTGTSTTSDRKRRIYEIASKHNIIILEDDPYYYLQFNEPKGPTYFSMDVDQRVLRFDSLSKIFSAGMRLGWVTGPKPLVDRIVLHGQATILHPSGISQLLAYQLLNKWRQEGFLQHTTAVAAFYKQKRDTFLASADKWLTGLAEWTVPDAGMFVWIKLLGIDDSSDLIKRKAMEKKVLLVPGFEFFPNATKTPYVRASFSIAEPKDMDEALRRLSELLKEAGAES